MPPTILLSLLAWPQLHCLVLVLEVVVADVDVDVVRLGKDVVVVDAVIVKHTLFIYYFKYIFKLTCHIRCYVDRTANNSKKSIGCVLRICVELECHICASAGEGPWYG